MFPWIPEDIGLFEDWFRKALFTSNNLPIPESKYSLFSAETVQLPIVSQAIHILNKEPIAFSLYLGIHDTDILWHHINGSTEYRHYRYTPFGDLQITHGFCYGYGETDKRSRIPSFEDQENNIKAFKLKKLLTS